LKGRTISYLKIAVSLLLLVVLFKIVDVKSLWRAISSVRMAPFFLSCALMVFTEVLIAIRLQVLMRPMNWCLPTSRLFRIGFISYFYAMFLPGGIGQIAAKWYKVTGNKMGRIQFLVVSIIEKSLFLLVTLVCVGIPFMFLSDSETSHLRTLFGPFIILFLAIEGFLYWFLLSPHLYRRTRLRLASLQAHLTGRLAEFMGHFGQIDPFIGQWRPPLLAVLLTIGVQLFIVIRIGLLFVSVGVDMPMVRVLLISSLIFFIQMIPISLGGLGVRESAFAYLFHLYGYGADTGVVVGLLFFGQIVLCAIVGGVLELTDRGSQPEAKAAAAAQGMDNR